MAFADVSLGTVSLTDCIQLMHTKHIHHMTQGQHTCLERLTSMSTPVSSKLDFKKDLATLHSSWLGEPGAGLYLDVLTISVPVWGKVRR